MTETTTAEKLAEARRAVYQAIGAVNGDRGLAAGGRTRAGDEQRAQTTRPAAIGGTDEDDRLLVGLLMDTTTALAIAEERRHPAQDQRGGLAERFIHPLFRGAIEEVEDPPSRDPDDSYSEMLPSDVPDEVADRNHAEEVPGMEREGCPACGAEWYVNEDEEVR